MRLKEIIAILISSLIGLVFTLQIQPVLFQTGSIPLVNVTPEEFHNSYIVGALIVLFTALLFTSIWYLNALRLDSKVLSAELLNKMFSVWIIFLVIVILIAISTLSFYVQSASEALLWLVLFWILDVVFLFYLPTAIATPGQLAHVVPFSERLRKIFKIDEE